MSLPSACSFLKHYWVSDPEAVWAEGRRVIPLTEAGYFPHVIPARRDRSKAVAP
jgi:hypothetical protein